MRSYIQVITTPTADTPATLLLLHFDEKRYFIGHLAEGTQRACNEFGVGQRKITDIFLTGRTEWANTGGLIGTMLSLADVKSTAQEAQRSIVKSSKRKSDQNKRPTENAKDALSRDNFRLHVYGAPNLTHTVATSRRFVFRTGIPMHVTEFPAEEVSDSSDDYIAPTLTDEYLMVWAMPILPQGMKPSKSARKRGFDESNGTSDVEDAVQLRKKIVTQMFNSDWRMDKLEPKLLSEVQLPATIFIKDPHTKELMRYQGPLPRGDSAVPDIEVLVRPPWPGSSTEVLPPTTPALESVSYIFKNHPQRGKFLPKKAKELGVPEGILWSKLARGETVQNTNGDDINPSMVLEPGKPGGGVAVVDIPTDDYVSPLLSRTEWKSKSVMEGVEAVTWILGPGVAENPLIRQFQNEHPHFRHIISSSEPSSSQRNEVVLEEAATSVLRHNAVDRDVYPRLQMNDTNESLVESQHPESHPYKTIAQRGLLLTLEPNIKLEEDKVFPSFNAKEVEAKMNDEVVEFDRDNIRSIEDGNSTEDQKWNTDIVEPEAEIVVLGTGSSHPSKQRNVSGTLVRVPGCGSYLFDCGEGTLGTLRRLFSATELNEILRDLRMIWISHMHADHHLGTTSVIKAWHEATSENGTSSNGVSNWPFDGLAVVSNPPMLHWLQEYGSVEEIGLSRLLSISPQPIRDAALMGEEVRPSRLQSMYSGTSEHPRQDFLSILGLKSLSTVFVNHCRGAQAISITCANGLKVSYSGDCRPSADFAAIGRGSHVLIHEATFEDSMRNQAIAKKHSTAGEALVVASEMNARACILTHFSQRYPSMPPLGARMTPAQRGARSLQLQQVLEQNKEEVAALNATAEEPVDGPGSSTWAEGGAADDPDGGGKLINEEDIEPLVSHKGMKVIFAFDYMRLKLRAIPRIVKKQPLLRALYEAGVDKDKADDLEEGAENLTGEEVREKKRLERIEKQKAKKEQDNEAKRANAEKWAKIGEYVADKKREYGLEDT